MPDKKFEDYFPAPDEEGESIDDLDFDALMQDSLVGVQKPRDDDEVEPGTRIEGTVITVSNNEVALEVSSKTTAVVDRDEFGDSPPSPGDRIAGEVVRYDPEKAALVVRVKEVQSQVFWEDLRTGVRLAGTVIGVNKGGLELKVGNERAFMPVSQIERHRVTDLNPYMGRRMEFEVTSFDRERKDLVVSQRVLLDEEYEAASRDVLASFHEGQVVSGSVVRVNQYGAFVDVGGFEGLLHASKIAKVDGLVVKEGQSISVEVAHIDLDQSRMGLDVHHSPESSWDGAAEDFNAGESATGVISRVTDEGAFLLIDEEVEGLIPTAELQRAGVNAAPGTVVSTEIESVDLSARRILLRLV